MTPDRTLDPAIEVLAGADVDDLWDRFEVFEALHHSTPICNPLTSAQLDEVVAGLDLRPGMVVLDVACGYGELLRRIRDRAPVATIGVDLSPWMITSAVGASRGENSTRWLLGDARQAVDNIGLVDLVVCIGAEWIWHDFDGTVRALAESVKPGGQFVVGAERLHLAAEPAEVRRRWGAVATAAEREAALRALGLDLVARIDASDAGWDAYLARTAEAARSWAARYPGERSDRWLAEQADWQAARDRDREIIGWSLWIAHQPADRTEKPHRFAML